jgi:hypothetical protein
LLVAVSGGGSGTGIAAMINGTVDIANASRKMKTKEMDLAKKNGQSPVPACKSYLKIPGLIRLFPAISLLPALIRHL